MDQPLDYIQKLLNSKDTKDTANVTSTRQHLSLTVCNTPFSKHLVLESMNCFQVNSQSFAKETSNLIQITTVLSACFGHELPVMKHQLLQRQQGSRFNFSVLVPKQTNHSLFQTQLLNIVLSLDTTNKLLYIYYYIEIQA